MIHYEFTACEYRNRVYCNSCLPDGLTVYDKDVSPIFFPKKDRCCACKTMHK